MTSPTIPVAGSDPQSFSSLQPQEAVVPVAAEGQVSGLREVEWVREDRDDGRGTLIYSLRNDGYRRGKAVRVNDVTVNIERSPASDTDVQEVIAQVMSALTGNASANTVGMSEANEPSPSNPPPEGKVASQREVARYIVTVGSDAANENNRRLHVNGSQWAKVYGWDQQSVETRAELLAEGLRSLDALASPTDQSSDVSGLVEALRPFAEAAGDLEPSDPDGMNLWEHPIAITLEAGHLRAALSALSQAQQVKP